MVATWVLLAALLVASITDLRRRLVYNWLTYSGMLLALAANGLFSVYDGEARLGSDQVWGTIGFPASAVGLLICGFAMLVCYVFFPGGVGGAPRWRAKALLVHRQRPGQHLLAAGTVRGGDGLLRARGGLLSGTG